MDLGAAVCARADNGEVGVIDLVFEVLCYAELVEQMSAVLKREIV
jgi:hypothetical protein